MNPSNKPPSGAAGAAAHSPANLAKAALRRLALSRLEPTPENYARAYAEEAGAAAPPVVPPRAAEQLERLISRLGEDAALRDDWLAAFVEGRWDEAQRAGQRLNDAVVIQSQGWAQLIDRLARALERGGRQWTAARKKESLQRVLDGSRSDMQRLSQRLRQLIGNWEQDTDDESVQAADELAPAEQASEPGPEAQSESGPVHVSLAADGSAAARAALELAGEVGRRGAAAALGEWPAVGGSFHGSVQVALQSEDLRARELADELASLAARIQHEGATPQLASQIAQACQRANRWLGHRHHLLLQLRRLCRELTEGLTELAEDDSWAKGQCENLRERLGEELSVRAVRAASELLAQTRERQHGLRAERERAREALKDLIQRMLGELGELGATTGRFNDNVQRYAQTIEQAHSLESLAGVVREMVEETHTVHERVRQTQERLQSGHTRASELEARVRELEGELRRLSDEVATDALTQVANRRGLMQQFESERARVERGGTHLAIGLMDIDNFKKLNDSLGHAAGDEALKALAAHVRQSLRPVDAVARFGGEEFVVLLPDTPVEEAQAALTRLQRTLSASLFMHEAKEVFVTFSAGVTAYRPGEMLEAALERADEALYEAKRTGKNRTCLG